ncbi:UDP-Glycosyltransferase superfamily protein, partial [Striga hermonthica]
MSDRERLRILMVSDFFFPNFGGVENHIYYLSQCLMKLGHKVVVMTHAYNNRSGVRYMTGGLKVYYVPWKPFLMQNTLPTFYGTLPIVRTIIIRERISLVHGHQAFSTLCHEALMHARTMGFKVVFTDHSLYGFADVGSIHMNKVLQFTLADVTQAICVSHMSKENTVLRSGLPPEKVFVIPNAVDTAMFKPARERISADEVVIIVISRLVYRKGVDLLVEVIPEVCRLHPNVRFIIGGDGPKKVRLDEMREKHSLQDKVDMLGAVPHAEVQSVLVKGHIFLNSSLTEAFCIAILEAASCGLLTVSTRVGGVPEVLPDDMIVLSEPDPNDMVLAIMKAIHLLPQIDPQAMHDRMKKLYSWHDVAKRTEIVYNRALKCSNQTLVERLPRTMLKELEKMQRLHSLCMDDNGIEERLLLVSSNADKSATDLKARIYEESKKIWKVATPSVISRVASFGTIVVTQSFIGHISSVDLAAYALVQAAGVRFVNGILIGMSSATETLCGQAYGAKQYHMMGIYLQRSWFIDFITLTILLPLFLYADPIFNLLGEQREISKSAGYFSVWFIPFAYSLIFSLTLQMYLQAQQKNAIIAWLSAFQLAIHVALSWLFVSVLGFGAAGAMGALSVASWFVVFGEFAYVFGGWCQDTWKGFTLAAFRDLVPVVKLSISSGIMFCLELWYLAILVLLAGYLKNAETAISTFSI